MKKFLKEISNGLNWHIFGTYLILANLIAIAESTSWMNCCLRLLATNGLMLLIAILSYFQNSPQVVENKIEILDQTKDIQIGAKYKHDKGRYNCVKVTNKTKNSIEFKDSKGFYQWFTIEEFSKFMKIIKEDES